MRLFKLMSRDSLLKMLELVNNELTLCANDVDKEIELDQYSDMIYAELNSRE